MNPEALTRTTKYLTPVSLLLVLRLETVRFPEMPVNGREAAVAFTNCRIKKNVNSTTRASARRTLKGLHGFGRLHHLVNRVVREYGVTDSVYPPLKLARFSNIT